MTSSTYINQKHLLKYSLMEQLVHGMQVSNLAFDIAKELSCSDALCYELAIAGVLHDIGKIEMARYMELYEESPLLVEEMKAVRMHPKMGCDILKRQGGYSDTVLESILYHHENYDGTGYPANLSGEEIPIGARILRVCDVYSALVTRRPYRDSFDREAAIELMIDEVQHFDMKIFLAFMTVIHKKPMRDLRLPVDDV